MTRISILLISVLIFAGTACGGKKTESSQQIRNASAGKEKQSLSPEAKEAGNMKQDVSFDISRILEAALNGEVPYIERALEQGFKANTTDEEMHTALMMAAYNGHSAIIALLLEHGADPNMRDLNDRTALMYASTGPFNESVTLLLKAGAKINLIDNEEHFTALMFAAAEGQAEVVRTLLNNGADKKLLDVDGESAYDFALNNGHEEVVKMLK